MLAALLLLLLQAAPICGADGRETARRELLEELNRERRSAGRPALEQHPALCAIARWRAERVRATGDPSAGMTVYREINRRLYESGYRPHAWTQSALVGDPLEGKLDQWRAVRPDWHREAVEGDFQHAGVGVETRSGQPVFAIVLGLPKCTVERRRAAALARLTSVRDEALDAVNRFRGESGLPPLGADPALDRAAQEHAESMQRLGFYAHRDPDGTTPRKRAAAAGYTSPGSVGENIAKGLFDGAVVVRRWMDSSGHRDNILRPEVRGVGLGVAVGDTGRAGECVEAVWVQLLGTAEPPAGSEPP